MVGLSEWQTVPFRTRRAEMLRFLAPWADPRGTVPLCRQREWPQGRAGENTRGEGSV
jgi:hypothetical protein